jgi:hypothetical protein
MTRAKVALCTSIMAASAVSVWSGQVPLSQEPRHKQLLYTANLRLLDVNIPVGDTTLDHLHEYDVATVAVRTSTTRIREAGQEWGPSRVRESGNLAIAEYTGTRRAHRIENIGREPYRVIAVENVRDGGWSTPTPVMAVGTTLAQESRAFSLYDVRLDGNTPGTTHTHDVPTVVVLVSGAATYQGAGGTDPFEIREPGRWILGLPGSPHTFRVSGTDEARIVEFEAR